MLSAMVLLLLLRFRVNSLSALLSSYRACAFSSSSTLRQSRLSPLCQGKFPIYTKIYNILVLFHFDLGYRRSLEGLSIFSQQQTFHSYL